MRKIEWLSYTSISLWEKEGPVAFYKRYLADIRPTHDKQTMAMAAGSAFDSMVKSRLARDLLGAAAPERLSFEVLFESSVEEQNRTQGRELAERLFEIYRACGAYTELLEELDKSPTAPRFEFSAGAASGSTVAGIPFYGRPDLVYSEGSASGAALVVLDWKVNGMMNPARTSPKAGAYRVRGALTGRETLSPATPSLHLVDEGWAFQLGIYGRMVGAEKFRVDQLCGPVTAARVASYRAPVAQDWLDMRLAAAAEIWQIISSGWIFREMSEDASREFQAALDTLREDPGFEVVCG